MVTASIIIRAVSRSTTTVSTVGPGASFSLTNANNNWFASPIISDRKSQFQGRHVVIHDACEVGPVMAKFKQEHRRIMKLATHPHIYAWRTGDYKLVNHQNAAGQWVKEKRWINVHQGYNDCGEKTGGSELLRRTIERYELYNVLVIVTRWMNGANIGASRFKHIGNAGTLLVNKGEFAKKS